MWSDWIYPETDICFACGDYVEGLGRAKFCASCRSKLSPVGEICCRRCGKPIADGEFCEWCRQFPRGFSQASAPYRYKGLARELILRLKYENHPELARAMAGEMALFFEERKEEKIIDCIVPVPLHRNRYRERGYNQAGLMAHALGKRWEIPVVEDWLIRTEATRALKELTAAERKRSLRHAFRLDSRFEPIRMPNHILLIDDVLTTGATAESCSTVFLKWKTKEIKVLTFATRA